MTSSRTCFKSLYIEVVVANEPMPSVSKKLVTNPIPTSGGVGLAGSELWRRRIAETQVHRKKTVTAPSATKSQLLMVSIQGCPHFRNCGYDRSDGATSAAALTIKIKPWC